MEFKIAGKTARTIPTYPNHAVVMETGEVLSNFRRGREAYEPGSEWSVMPAFKKNTFLDPYIQLHNPETGVWGQYRTSRLYMTVYPERQECYMKLREGK